MKEVFVLLDRLNNPVGVSSSLDGAIDSFRSYVFSIVHEKWEPESEDDYEDIDNMMVRYVEEDPKTYRLEYTRPQTSHPLVTLRVKVFIVDNAW